MNEEMRVAIDKALNEVGLAISNGVRVEASLRSTFFDAFGDVTFKKGQKKAVTKQLNEFLESQFGDEGGYFYEEGEKTSE